MKLRVLTFVLAGLLASPAVMAAEQGVTNPNTIVNGTFDTDYNGWSPWKPKGKPDIVIDPVVTHSGAASLRITGYVAGDRGSVGQQVKVKAGETYTLRAWIKTQDVKPNGAMIRVQFNVDGNPTQKTRDHLYLGRLGGSRDWTLLETSFSIPEKTGTLSVELFLDSAIGSVWWDDVEIVPSASVVLSATQPTARTLPSGAVSISWGLPAVFIDTGVQFRIYRSALANFSIDSYPSIGTTDQMQFVDRDTKAGQTYYYRVLPVGKDSEAGSVSAPIKVTVSATAPACKPLTFFADWATQAARLSWDLGDSRARQIRVERKELTQGSSSDWQLVTVLPAWMLSYLDKNLPGNPQEGKAFGYRITVVGPNWEEAGPVESVLSGFIPLIPRAADLGQHPSLLITEKHITELKEAAKLNPGVRMLLDSEILSPAQSLAASLSTIGVSLPGKDETTAHANLARQARTVALGYAFTGNTTMAETAKKILLAYARDYKKFPLKNAYDGHVTYQTLNEAPWLVDIAWTYDLIWNSGLLTPDERKAIENDLLWEAVRVIDRYDKGLSNWQAWHNAGIGAVAFLLGDQRWIDEVLTGPQSFAIHIRNGIRDDGIWWEQSIGYHSYTRNALTLLAEMAYQNGYDLYSFSTRGKNLKLMFDATINHAFSDGMHPVVGNASYNAKLEFDWGYGVAARRYSDPKYATLFRANMGSSGNIPTSFFLTSFQSAPRQELAISTEQFAPAGVNLAGSSLFADTGMAVLRSPEGANSLEAALLFKPHGTTIGHQAADNLTLMVEGLGGRWLPGTGSFDYNRVEQGTWYKQTVARNGVVVDEMSQYPQGVGTGIFVGDGDHSSAGKLLHFTALPTVSAAVATTDQVYDGVQMERFLLLSTPYIIDRYRMTSSKTHTYDWVAHFDGKEGAISVNQQPRIGNLGSQAGYQHISNLRIGESADMWNAVWEKGNASFRLTMLGSEPTQIIRASGFGPNLSQQPMIVARRQAATTEFVTVMETYRGKPVIAEINKIPIADGLTGVTIKRTTEAGQAVEDKLYWHVDGLVGNEVTQVTNNQRFQADTAFFRGGDNGQVDAMLMLGGTLIESGNLRVTADAKADVALERANGQLYSVVQTSDNVIKLTVRTGRPDGTVRLFRLGDKVDGMGVAELAPETSGTETTWVAQPGVIYILGAQQPTAEWLERFVKTIKL